MARIILFDLDGTLTDPKEGITKSIQHALGQMGIDEPDLDSLTRFIGPPLQAQLEQAYGWDREQGDRAIEHYRDRFDQVGKFENIVYDGIPDLLDTLCKQGAVLGVATLKPEVFANQILEHFHLSKYFGVVAGSGLDGSFQDKGEVIGEALKRLGVPQQQWGDVIMVGDRYLDVEGAIKEGLHPVAVEYGYGSFEELAQAGAKDICKTVGDLKEYLCG